VHMKKPITLYQESDRRADYDHSLTKGHN